MSTDMILTGQPVTGAQEAALARKNVIAERFGEFAQAYARAILEKDWQTLGLEFTDWQAEVLGGVKLAIGPRRQVAKALEAAGKTVRQIAAATGVSKSVASEDVKVTTYPPPWPAETEPGVRKSDTSTQHGGSPRQQAARDREERRREFEKARQQADKELEQRTRELAAHPAPSPQPVTPPVTEPDELAELRERNAALAAALAQAGAEREEFRERAEKAEERSRALEEDYQRLEAERDHFQREAAALRERTPDEALRAELERVKAQTREFLAQGKRWNDALEAENAVLRSRLAQDSPGMAPQDSPQDGTGMASRNGGRKVSFDDVLAMGTPPIP